MKQRETSSYSLLWSGFFYFRYLLITSVGQLNSGHLQCHHNLKNDGDVGQQEAAFGQPRADDEVHSTPWIGKNWAYHLLELRMSYTIAKAEIPAQKLRATPCYFCDVQI